MPVEIVKSMKTSFKTIGSALALLSILAVAVAVDGFTFKRAPKEGEVIKYRIKADIALAGIEATFSGLNEEKVTKVEENGNYTVETKATETKLSVAGQEQDVPDQPATRSTYNPRGLLVAYQGADSGSGTWRMANLSGFYAPEAPVAVGAGWTFEQAADEKKETPAFKATFKVLAEEKVNNVDVVKVEGKVEETGSDAASITSIFWLDKKDWSPVKAEGDWKNVPLPGAPGPVNAKYTLVREG